MLAHVYCISILPSQRLPTADQTWPFIWYANKKPNMEEAVFYISFYVVYCSMNAPLSIRVWWNVDISINTHIQYTVHHTFIHIFPPTPPATQLAEESGSVQQWTFKK